MDFIYAESATDGFSRAPAVSGQHDHAYSGVVQCPQGFRGGLLDGIGHSDQAGGLAVHRHVNDRLAFLAQRVGTVQPQRVRLEFGLHQQSISQEYTAAVHGPGNSLACRRLEARGLGELHAAVCRAFHNRGGQRVLARPFETCCEHEKLCLADPFDGFDRHDFRAALRQRPRLVDNQR